MPVAPMALKTRH